MVKLRDSRCFAQAACSTAADRPEVALPEVKEKTLCVQDAPGKHVRQFSFQSLGANGYNSCREMVAIRRLLPEMQLAPL